MHAVIGRRLQSTLEVCILGTFPRPKKCKVGNKFIDLSLALAKRRISMSWKSPLGPDITRWESDVQLWTGAGEQALLREKGKGLRKENISTDWATVLHEFTHGDVDSDNVTVVTGSPDRNEAEIVVQR